MFSIESTTGESPPGDAEHAVQLGTNCVRVRLRGEGTGPPLLLLNGLGGQLDLWDPLLRRLGGRSIAFDAPGSGGSRAPLMPLSIGGHARLALALLDHLDEPLVNVLGLSFGGMVAQELTHLAPGRVERLILSSTCYGWGSIPGGPAALLSSMAAPESQPADARGYLYQIWAAMTWSSFCWLPELTQPTLVLAGDADCLVPRSNADLLTALLPNARKHIVAGGGHLCLLEQAQQVAPLVAGFLSYACVAQKV